MKPATMFAFTATPLPWPAAAVPKAPRWHPVNCAPVLPVYTISSSSIERMPYVAAKPPVVDATLIAESPARIAPVAVVSRGFAEDASTGVYRLAALSIAPG